jgi:hypothetical protein
MQETVASFEVRCCASQLLHEARRGVHSCVQAAAAARVAAARVAGGLDIWKSAKNGDGVSVLRHLIADADAVAARDRCFSPPPSHHVSLTIRLAAVATLHSIMPFTKAKPTLLHTCAASARLLRE